MERNPEQKDQLLAIFKKMDSDQGDQVKSILSKIPREDDENVQEELERRLMMAVYFVQLYSDKLNNINAVLDLLGTRSSDAPNRMLNGIMELVVLDSSSGSVDFAASIFQNSQITHHLTEIERLKLMREMLRMSAEQRDGFEGFLLRCLRYRSQMMVLLRAGIDEVSLPNIRPRCDLMFDCATGTAISQRTEFLESLKNLVQAGKRSIRDQGLTCRTQKQKGGGRHGQPRGNRAAHR